MYVTRETCSRLGGFKGIQAEENNGEGGRRYTREAPDLTEILRAGAVKSLNHFVRKAAYLPVIEVNRDGEVIVAIYPFTDLALGSYVAMIQKVCKSCFEN